MIDFKLNLETESFSLIQTEDSHFEELYLVAGNPIIWEQHPEKDRWKKEIFSNLFQTAILFLRIRKPYVYMGQGNEISHA